MVAISKKTSNGEIREYPTVFQDRLKLPPLGDGPPIREIRKNVYKAAEKFGFKAAFESAQKNPLHPMRKVTLYSEMAIAAASVKDFEWANVFSVAAIHQAGRLQGEYMAIALVASHTVSRMEALHYRAMKTAEGSARYEAWLEAAPGELDRILFYRNAGRTISPDNGAYLVGEGEYGFARRGDRLGTVNTNQCVALAVECVQNGDKLLIHLKSIRQVRELGGLVERLSGAMDAAQFRARALGAVQGISKKFDAHARRLWTAVHAMIDKLGIDLLSADVLQNEQPKSFVVTENFTFEEKVPSAGRCPKLLDLIAVHTPNAPLRPGLDLRNPDRVLLSHISWDILNGILTVGDRTQLLEHLYTTHFDEVPIVRKMGGAAKVAGSLKAFDEVLKQAHVLQEKDQIEAETLGLGMTRHGICVGDETEDARVINRYFYKT